MCYIHSLITNTAMVATRRRNKGGKPVFAGAQGCVFVPSLKCKNRPRNMTDGNISKLGYRAGSESEIREQEKIMPYIKKIRNYEKFFSVRASSCEPDALTPHDLEGFNETCINFDKDIDASNVNRNLDKLRAINMPHLGTDLTGWMEKSPLDARRVRQLNDHISMLLVRAIVPMNQQGVLHNDLKSENLMMDTAETTVRVIDWGLAGITAPHHVIPEHHFMNNPVTFNRPFSTMIISHDIDALYHNFISQLPANFDPQQLEPFVNGLYTDYRKMAPTGHDYLTYIFKSMFNMNTETATRVLTAVIEKYNAVILYHFTNPARRKFMLHEYFNKVYRYNTDVWGTMSVFYSMFMLPRNHFIMPDSTYAAMLQQYRALFRTIVFVNGHKRMNVQRIVQHLRQINNTVAAAQNKSVKKMVKFNIATRNPRHTQRVPTPHPLKGVY